MVCSWIMMSLSIMIIITITSRELTSLLHIILSKPLIVLIGKWRMAWIRKIVVWSSSTWNARLCLKHTEWIWVITSIILQGLATQKFRLSLVNIWWNIFAALSYLILILRIFIITIVLREHRWLLRVIIYAMKASIIN